MDRLQQQYITHTAGHPDGGDAVNRPFRAPIQQMQLVQPQQQNSIQGTVTADVMEEDAAPQPTPQATPPLAPTQSVETDEDQAARKRARADGSQADDDQAEADRRQIVQYLGEQLSTLPGGLTNALSSKIINSHTKYLDAQRQLMRLTDKINMRECPRGWRVNDVNLGPSNATHAAKIKELQIDSVVAIMQQMQLAKNDDLERHKRDKTEHIDDAIAEMKASIERITTTNPERYDVLDREAVLDQARIHISIASIEAEVKADKRYDAKAKEIAEKQLAHELRQRQSEQETLEQQNTTITAADLNSLRQQFKDEILAGLPKRNRPDRSARKAETSKNNHKSQNQKSANSLRQKSQTGKTDTTKSKKSNRGQNKGQTYRSRPPQLVSHRKVVNLTSQIPPASLVSALGLGETFRLTPKPATDDTVTLALRGLSKAIKNSAYHVLYPSDRPYNPKLYHPTGNRMDPEEPPLDHCIEQYQHTITKAMRATHPHTISTPPNTSNAERRAIIQLQQEITEGTAQFIPLPSDKDRALCLVSPVQHQQLWEAQMGTPMFTQIDPDSIEWNPIRNRVRHAVNWALTHNLITHSEHRFLTKDSVGSIRTPRANLLVKTHKLMTPYRNPPAKTRLYIDTVNWATTPLAKYISVALTPAREQIPYRIRDTPDLMRQISSKTYSQNSWLITLDIVDFYPQTTVLEGEAIIKQHLTPEIADLCVRFSTLIHDTMYLETPIGWYRAPDRYGIGFAHSGEVCDLVWANVEATVLPAISALGIDLQFYGRMVDDCLLVVDCTLPLVHQMIHLFQTADPNKSVTYTISNKSADFLDVTLYKGPQFTLTGHLDTRQYTKPSTSGLHLPQTSFHPTATFGSILFGAARRALVASSRPSLMSGSLSTQALQYLSRGYNLNTLKATMLQGCWKRQRQRQRRKQAAEFKALKAQALEPKHTLTHGKVIALKLPYTPRSKHLQKYLNLPTLQQQIVHFCPALCRARLGRLVMCHLKTRNIGDLVRQRYKGPPALQPPEQSSS